MGKEDSVKKNDIHTFSVIGLLLITVIGTGLRIYRLGYQSLWYDEILTFLSSSGTFTHVLFQTEIETYILPLYYLVVHAFLYLGEEDVILRIPSLIFGSLSIPLFFLVVREILGAETGVLASFLLAISPFHIFFSQEARPYAMFLFLCLLALYLLQQCLKHKESNWLKLGFAVVAASTLYCHTVAIPFLMFLALYLVLMGSQIKLKEWGGTVSGLTILLLPALYRIMMIQEESGLGRSFELSYLPYVMWAFSTGFSLGPTLLELHLTDKMNYVIEYLPMIVPILVYISGLVLFGAKKLFQKNRTHFLVLCLFFLLPLMFMSFAAIVISRPFNVRHIIPSLLPFLVFVALGIQNLNKRPLQFLGVGIFIVISVFSLKNYYFEDRYHREDYRGASQFLTAHSTQGDLIICMVPYTRTGLLYYLSSDNKLALVGYPKNTAFVDPTQIPEDLLKIIATRDRFWVLYSRVFAADPRGHLKSYLETSFSPSNEFHSTGVELILYEIP